MDKAIRQIVACVAVVSIGGCSLRGDPVSLGKFSTDKLIDKSCVLERLDEHSRELTFHPGSGKPYRVIFQIRSADVTECDPRLDRIAVDWKDLVIDEIPDFGESKIRLVGKARAIIGDKRGRVLCHTNEPLVAYSEWYPVKSHSLFEFRPPEDPHDPVAASMIAFERFLGEFIEFVTQECL